MNILVGLLYWIFMILVGLVVSLVLLASFKGVRVAWQRGWIHSGWNGLKSFGTWTGNAAWPKVRQVPGRTAQVTGWAVSKLGILIVLLILLGLYGIAIDIAILAFRAGIQYEGDLFVTMFKWAGLAFAALLAAIVTPPFFGTLRKLAR